MSVFRNEEENEAVLEIIEEINSKMKLRSLPYWARRRAKMLDNGEIIPIIVVASWEKCGIRWDVANINLVNNRDEIIDYIINESIARLED